MLNLLPLLIIRFLRSQLRPLNARTVNKYNLGVRNEKVPSSRRQADTRKKTTIDKQHIGLQHTTGVVYNTPRRYKKYQCKCTTDQEPMAYTLLLHRRAPGQTLRVYLPGGGSFQRKLTSWPAAILKLWHHCHQIENSPPSIDAHLRREHFYQILRRSNLKKN